LQKLKKLEVDYNRWRAEAFEKLDIQQEDFQNFEEDMV